MKKNRKDYSTYQYISGCEGEYFAFKVVIDVCVAVKRKKFPNQPVLKNLPARDSTPSEAAVPRWMNCSVNVFVLIVSVSSALMAFRHS